MNKKSIMAMVAITLFACGSASAQFVTLSPSDLVATPTAGQTINVNNVNIGQLLGLNASDLQVSVTNAVVAQNTNLFAVNQLNSTLFTYSGSAAVEAFVQHGQTLGNNYSGGVQPRDGVTSATSFTLDAGVTPTLDTDYQFGSSASDYFVAYTGATNSVSNLQNSTPFRFVSSAPVTNYTVFSTNNNGTVVNNNFSTGLQVVSTIPEPSATIVLALGGLLGLRRKRSV